MHGFFEFILMGNTAVSLGNRHRFAQPQVQWKWIFNNFCAYTFLFGERGEKTHHVAQANL